VCRAPATCGRVHQLIADSANIILFSFIFLKIISMILVLFKWPKSPRGDLGGTCAVDLVGSLNIHEFRSITSSIKLQFHRNPKYQCSKTISKLQVPEPSIGGGGDSTPFFLSGDDPQAADRTFVQTSCSRSSSWSASKRTVFGCQWIFRGIFHSFDCQVVTAMDSPVIVVLIVSLFFVVSGE
jgi:hypothetical protein